MDGTGAGARWRAAAALLAVAVVAGCTGGGEQDPPGPPAPSSSRDVPLACTEIGDAEGVSVDLSQVLSLEGGDHHAEVGVPSLGASSTRGFAGNDWYYPSGDVQADLTADEVEVTVRVVTERGDTAYETSDLARPVLYQPNGAQCDGENHRIDLVATADGELLPRARDALPTDARGRTTQAVGTACGVEHHTDGLRAWRRVGGLLGDGAGGPPPGWNTPAQRGWMTPQGDDLLLFEDERGHVEQFVPVTDGWFPAPCG